MVFTYVRGHLCEYQNSKWIYSDNRVPIGNEVRPCKRCGEMPTSEGYDTCLGYISGAISACCGHGINKKFVL
jgi:hypothetical protein